MALFTRRASGGGKLRKRLDTDMARIGDLAQGYAGKAADGSFDPLPFTTRAFELAPTRDIEHLISRGCDGSEFFLREIGPNWRGLTREQRAARIAAFVRFANLLDQTDEGERQAPDQSDDAIENLAELRATVRTKIVLLASAYDAEYDDSYCRRIARNPRQFGQYELTRP